MRNSGVLPVTLLLLLVLNAGLFLLADRPLVINPMRLEVPQTLADGEHRWVGEDDPLTHHERAVLAPAELTSRIYRPLQVGGPDGDAWRWLWLDVLRSDSVGTMHNFFDSMIASGGRPQILGERVVQTDRGPLRATLVRNQGSTGKTFYMLLWYQWPEGTAPGRWQWYGEVLKLRLQGRQSSWLLVKIASPVRKPDQPLPESPELARMEAFARAFYESAAFQPSTSR